MTKLGAGSGQHRRHVRDGQIAINTCPRYGARHRARRPLGQENQNVLEPIMKVIGARKFRELSAAEVRQALATMATGYSSAAVTMGHLALKRAILWGSITRSILGGLPGWRSSLGDLLGRLPARSMPARLPDGAGPA
jgi:hypothetical protein